MRPSPFGLRKKAGRGATGRGHSQLYAADQHRNGAAMENGAAFRDNDAPPRNAIPSRSMSSPAPRSATAPYRERDMANAIRALAMDAVQLANSGHPGMPMGMAEIAIALWHRHLRHSPGNPRWADRDRFVLSNGHGSM